MKKKIGLIVNPVAGMGGSVGLKGTDGDMYRKALELGAQPVTPVRTQDFIAHIKRKEEIDLLTAPGCMGEDYVQDFPRLSFVVGTTKEETSAEDTKQTARHMVELGIGLLLFVGGDGTARDICDAVGLEVPVVAVPSGVKVFSAVFATSARAAAGMVDAFLEGSDTTEEDVLDIDEGAFRENRLASKLYGALLVPNVKNNLQRGKECSSTTASAAESKIELAEYIIENMDNHALTLLGPGTTLKAVADAAGVAKTLLGVDALAEEKLVGSDVNEREILALCERFKRVVIIVTPIGGNGFIFGRGSKQFTPEVIRRAGRENIIVAAAPDKLKDLDALRVDTGDYDLDRSLSGYMEVLVGRRETVNMEVRC